MQSSTGGQTIQTPPIKNPLTQDVQTEFEDVVQINELLQFGTAVQGEQEPLSR